MLALVDQRVSDIEDVLFRPGGLGAAVTGIVAASRLALRRRVVCRSLLSAWHVMGDGVCFGCAAEHHGLDF